jgi:hypothetical protein
VTAEVNSVSTGTFAVTLGDPNGSSSGFYFIVTIPS